MSELTAFIPRPKQHEVLAYAGGRMGVSAVPGSGKTWTLSRLAAEIIASGVLADDQEVLVVTLVNSAVDNFYQRVSGFVRQLGLLPHLGYRVRTLHGLAHDIVRERPDLAGLADNFQIVDEREADNIRDQAARVWLSSHPDGLDGYLDRDLDESRRDRVVRENLPGLVSEVASSFIRYAKDLRLTPERLRLRLDRLPLPLPLAEMGWEIFNEYQRALLYRGAVDFDDLIRLALEVLQQDETLLVRLRHRWPYILEDEAQDSSRLQEEILGMLAGRDGNWVRVGDPNQAIFETFTTADPRYLREFIASPSVLKRELPNSGRSTLSIIELANRLVAWAQAEHPVPEVRDALQAPPLIEPSPPGDPQPNPPDDPTQVQLVLSKLSPAEEILAVADSLERWLPDHREYTVAVLAPRNERGIEMVEELRRRGIDVVDSLLRSTSATRQTAGALGNLLRYLSDPGSPTKLATVYRVWQREASSDPSEQQRRKRSAELLRKSGRVEDFLWPRPGQDWLQELESAGEEPFLLEELGRFRELVRRWQEAVLLPVDQVLLGLAQDLFDQPGELALAHKLAVLVRRAGEAHPEWRLPELTGELAVIARNERRFLGFSEEDTGFNPDAYKGRVVVATMHKAKGLEWDRVYLMSVNNYDFPSGLSNDQYIAEKWYLRDHLNLEAEALAQLDALLGSGEYDWYAEGEASARARLDYVRERLRLLYVGITRAKRELVITWNTGRFGDMQPAVPFVALHAHLQDDLAARGLNPET
ncbi:MAG TPA: ATP-dependent helicase [Anaerolineales bacterium]|nr:ATP-dependent helicase [Anaerolineales bacterium]